MRRPKAVNSSPEQIPETKPTAKKKGDGDTRKTRAKIAGTNEKYIDLADKLVETRPDLAEDVKQGRKTLTQVSRELKREQVSERVKALPEGKFRVIYADAPWTYNDSREGLGEGQAVADALMQRRFMSGRDTVAVVREAVAIAARRQPERGQ